MAGVKAKFVTPEIATGTAAKVILLITAAANHRVLLKGFNIAFKGVTNTDAPILVRISRISDVGVGGISNPALKLNPSDTEALQVTGLQGPAGAWGTDPSLSETFWRTEVHPQLTHREWFPFGEEIVIPGGASVGISVTASVSVSAIAAFDVEE